MNSAARPCFRPTAVTALIASLALVFSALIHPQAVNAQTGTGLVTFLTGGSGSTGSNLNASSFTFDVNTDGGANGAVDRLLIVNVIVHKPTNGGDDAPFVSSISSTPTYTFVEPDVSPTDATTNSFAIANGDVRISEWYAPLPNTPSTLGTIAVTVNMTGVARGLATAYICTRVNVNSFVNSIQAINNSGNPQFESVPTGGPTSGLILNVVGFDSTQNATLPPGLPECNGDSTANGCAINASEFAFATTVNTAGGNRNANIGSYLIQHPNNPQLVGFDVGAAAQWIQLRIRLTPNAVSNVGYVSGSVDTYAAKAAGPGGALVRWRTGFEVDNLGFNVYRDSGGRRTKVTPELVAGSALGASAKLLAGYSYAFWDPEGSPGDAYWVEDIDLSGATQLHGPYVSASISGGAPPAAKAVMLSDLAAQAPAESHSLFANEIAQERPRLPRAAKLAAAGDVQWDLAGRQTVKLSVNETGWYRVTRDEITAAGLDLSSADPRSLRLFADGIELPIVVAGEADGRFDAGDAVEFFGTRVDTQTTDTHVYWLSAGVGTGKRVKVSNVSAQQSASPSFPSTVELKERLVYFTKAANGDKENWFGRVVASTPVDHSLTLNHVDLAGSGAQVELALQGVTSGSHAVTVAVNGVGVGSLTFQDITSRTSTLAIPSGVLQEGANVVTLTRQGGTTDVSVVDYVRVTYPHLSAADNNALALPLARRAPLTVSGFSAPAIRVVDVTDPAAVAEYTGNVAATGGGYAVSLTVPSTTTRQVYAFTPDRVKHPAISINTPSAWNRTTNAADIVMITNSAFTGELGPLVAQRTAEGYRVAVVDVADLYDEFSYGYHSPLAIRAFVTRARAAWQTAPRFVLLVGNASYDPRDYFHIGGSDFVPTKLIETTTTETSSDDWLVDVNNDDTPDLAVGRLPVTTAAEAHLVVAKIVGYAQAGPTSPRAVLVADAPDGVDFDVFSDEIAATMPSSIAVQRVSRAAVGDSAARQQTLDALNGGPTFVNYAGHGSVDLWRANVLTSEDAATLGNSHLSVFTIATCLNGYFPDPFLPCLGRALMGAPNGGAVAVVASSGINQATSQQLLCREIYSQLLNGRQTTLGEAILRAKQGTAAGDTRRTVILLGDPLTRLR